MAADEREVVMAARRVVYGRSESRGTAWLSPSTNVTRVVQAVPTSFRSSCWEAAGPSVMAAYRVVPPLLAVALWAAV